jgi:hypothetical protein
MQHTQSSWKGSLNKILSFSCYTKIAKRINFLDIGNIAVDLPLQEREVKNWWFQEVKYMQYKITRQYARDVEMPLAEFDAAADAKFFLKVKLAQDAELHIAAIYRLCKDGELLAEINKSNINVAGIPARYFLEEENQPVQPHFYKVAKQVLSSMPVFCMKFIEIKDAKLLIEKMLIVNRAANEKITYRLFKGDLFLEKFDPHKIIAPTKPEEGAGFKKDESNAVTFHPTPFNKMPRPAGSSPSWIKEQAKKKIAEKEAQK